MDKLRHIVLLDGDPGEVELRLSRPASHHPPEGIDDSGLGRIGSGSIIDLDRDPRSASVPGDEQTGQFRVVIQCGEDPLGYPGDVEGARDQGLVLGPHRAGHGMTGVCEAIDSPNAREASDLLGQFIEKPEPLRGKKARVGDAKQHLLVASECVSERGIVAVLSLVSGYHRLGLRSPDPKGEEGEHRRRQEEQPQIRIPPFSKKPVQEHLDASGFSPPGNKQVRSVLQTTRARGR